MGGWSQPLTSCVIRFHFINGLMRDRFARARRSRRADRSAPLRSSWVATPASALTKEPDRRALMPNDWGIHGRGRGLGWTILLREGGGQRVVGVQVRSACRHLAAYAESATRWIIHPRRLDPRAGPRSRRRPASGWIPSPVFNPYGLNALIAWLVI